MKYDIVPMNSVYRGIERSFTPLMFTSKKAKKCFNYLIEKYFEYISYLELPYCKEVFSKLVHNFHIFIEYEISCELIVYDYLPLSDVYGYNIMLLGLDIVTDLSESLISDNLKTAQIFLNNNGLYDDINQAKKTISLLKQNKVNWQPCWVYKVLC